MKLKAGYDYYHHRPATAIIIITIIISIKIIIIMDVDVHSALVYNSRHTPCAKTDGMMMMSETNSVGM